MSGRATALAHSNVALVKYWGKREGVDPSLNLPETGSISITLGELQTRTTVVFDGGLDGDKVSGIRDKDHERVSQFLGLVRERAGIETFAEVRTENDFPTGAGLASSASGFAALAMAASHAADLELSKTELSQLARRGSGSAARSIFGGFAEQKRGQAPDGSDCHAVQLQPWDHWPLSVAVAIVDEGEKPVSSTAGMLWTAETSPFYAAWLADHTQDLETVRSAINERDFDKLAHVTEHNCLKMHATMLTAIPTLLYWNATTLAVMRRIWQLRELGTKVCFSIDAGPQVKAICDASSLDIVAATLESVPGVKRVIRSGLGTGASLIDTEVKA